MREFGPFSFQTDKRALQYAGILDLDDGSQLPAVCIEALGFLFGKDRIIFATKEDHATPSNAELVEEDPNDPYEERGLILPNGEINWNCPCLGGMASGPCGSEFKDAFSCFHYSKEEVKGSECLEQFRAMQECIQRYPELYPQEDDKVSEEKSSETEQASQNSAPAETSEENSTSAPVQDSDPIQPNTESSVEGS
ncbi:coiled-coil-helix-coiled-coil-helix domain containing 4b [Scomber scombrus]|uniref:coiled-coil-helix-coiled-coil-helix domain containing 4b n=1 Tax=Scomber scombrus TaxID=13677 RepID=UPI002DDBE435|nr:coiled-coil-helix-coiled-coil-helix domain containing 4b [Scomber scombrus]